MSTFDEILKRMRNGQELPPNMGAVPGAVDLPGYDQSAMMMMALQEWSKQNRWYIEGFANSVVTTGTISPSNLKLSAPGRELLGISISVPEAVGIEDTEFTLKINNDSILTTVSANIFRDTTLREKMFFPTPALLDGDSKISYRLANNTPDDIDLTLNFFYLPQKGIRDDI